MPAEKLRQRLLDLVGRFRGCRVAVAGDFVLDRFVHGLPKRISREAPVLILKFSREEKILGGGANTAANIASLGGVPLPVGAVGTDREGESLRALFASAGIETSFLLPVADYPTPSKTRILGGGTHSIKQQVVRIDREEPLPESRELTSELEKNLSAALSSAQALVLSDYGYGSSRPGWIALSRARDPKIRILVDSRFRLSEYTGADAATPNEEELERLSPGANLDSEREFETAGRSVLSNLATEALLVTRGSRGMTLFEKDGRLVSLPVHGTDQVADVTGAGDTVIATFSLALASGASYREAALLSNFAGGIVVMKMGTATVSHDELAGSIEEDRRILALLTD